jgi:DEAD/DEAH box helicase domain-containing protein
VHDGAVYLHQGRPWRVDRLDLIAGIATVNPDDGTTSTSTRTDTDIAVIRTLRSRQWPAATLGFGEVEVTTAVQAYERRDIFSGESIGITPLTLEPVSLRTRALWLTVDHSQLGGLMQETLPGSAHAAEHAAIGLLPLFAMCDRWDIGGVSTVWHPDTHALTIFIYDGYPGGAGITERGYETDDGLWLATRDAIAGCPCAGGCPSCIQSPKCGNGNNPLHKSGAVMLLDVALQMYGSARAVARR